MVASRRPIGGCPLPAPAAIGGNDSYADYEHDAHVHILHAYIRIYSLTILYIFTYNYIIYHIYV